MQPKKTFHLYLCLSFSGVLCIVGGLVLIILRTSIFNFTLNKILTLTPGTQTFKLWAKTPFPIYLDVYLFNWTNPQDFYSHSIKPKFKEIGPYRFKHTIEKSNVTFNSNDTVSFFYNKHWTFVREQSVGSLDDPVTTINPVAVSAAYAARNWNYFLKKGVSITLSSIAATVKKTKTVGETFISGYDEPLIDLVNRLPKLSYLADLPSLPPVDKFGWFYGRNGSIAFDGFFNMGSGNSKPLGQMYNWNYWSQTPYYQGKCGAIQGYVGEFFPTNLTKDYLDFFNTEMCRTVRADYLEEETIHNINGFKYTMDDSFLDNGTITPENACYCTGECVPYGMLNVSSCRYGAPGFVSLPHFYKADPYYMNLVDGLEPNEEKHSFDLTIEPTTGIPLRVAARVQLNLMVDNVKYISMFENIPRRFFPVLWMEEIVEIPEDLAVLVQIFLHLKIICIVMGVLSMLTGMCIQTFVLYKICTMNLFFRPHETRYFPRARELVPLSGVSKLAIIKECQDCDSSQQRLI